METNHNLIHQASISAQHRTKVWIRAVLREVALHSLQQTCLIDNSCYRVHAQAVDTAQAACRRVANRWKSHLNGFPEVGEWIDDLVKNESAVLYHCKEPPKESTTHAAVADSSTLANNKTASSLGKSPLSNPKRLRLLSEVMKNGKLDDDCRVKKCIDMLNEWGRRGTTEWPFDWSVIEQAVQEIPKRLHRWKDQQQEEIVFVPKSLCATSDHDQQQQENKNNETATERAIELLVERKRKSRKRKRGPVNQEKAHKPVESAAEEEGEARPPFDAANRLASHTDWSEEERRQLDACLHDNHEDDQVDGVLIGALQDVGHYRWYEAKESLVSDAYDDKTDKQQRMWQNARVRERLSRNKPAGFRPAASRQVYPSRVVHSQVGNRFFMDLDMSDMIMEWKFGSESKLLAFSNAEIVLEHV